jgi:hypothetical protein
MAEEKKAKNGGISSRAKKFMASRTAGTKLGRKAILDVLGEDGELLFNSIKESAKIYFGEVKGKQLKEDMLKMILKINLMVSEKKLTPENTAIGQEPVHALLFQAQLDFDGTGHQVDPSAFVKRMNDVSNVWMEIVKKQMQENNLQKLREVLDMLGDKQFLDKLFNDAAYKEHRDNISAGLARLMNMFGISDQNAATNCQVSNCLNKVVRSRGLFRSAGFCAMHHHDHFTAMCEKPALQDFLLDERASAMLTEFLTEEDDMSPFHLLKAISDFKAISSQQIRSRSINAIKSKYLETGAKMPVTLSQDGRSDILEKIDAINDDSSSHISTGLFGGIEAEVREHLGQSFDTKFVKSEYFQRFKASYMLTNVDQKIAEKQRQGL